MDNGRARTHECTLARLEVSSCDGNAAVSRRREINRENKTEENLVFRGSRFVEEVHGALQRVPTANTGLTHGRPFGFTPTFRPLSTGVWDE